MDAKAAKKAHIGKMARQLQGCGAKIDDFMAKAEKAGAETRNGYREQIDELKAKYHAAQTKLDELQAADAERWSAVKAGVHSAWVELEATFKKLKG